MISPERPGRNLARRAALAAAPPLRRLYEDRELLRRELARAVDDAVAAKSRVAAFEAAGAVEPPRSYDYLFIISYGRSGSTLLQGILCSAPGVLIRGENREGMYRLYEYHSGLAEMHDKYTRRDPMTPTDSWYGLDEWTREESLAGLRAFVLATLLRPKPDTRVIGFKEIRWWQKDWSGYLDFLQELFPGARFVINTRDHARVAASKWWAERENPLATLARYEKQLDAMAAQLGARAYRVHHDDYVADPGVLAGLFEWLGEPFDRAAVEAVMSVRHSA